MPTYLYIALSCCICVVYTTAMYDVSSWDVHVVMTMAYVCLFVCLSRVNLVLSIFML